jgi:hypothetical protein
LNRPFPSEASLPSRQVVISFSKPKTSQMFYVKKKLR